MKRLIYLGAMISMIALASCSKEQDRTYYDYIKDGAIVYTGRADSLKAFAGDGRVMLKWYLPSDQNITGCKIFWNFGADSLIMAVKKSPKPDTIQVPISLQEGSYNFEVVTFDKQGHTSIKAEAIGNSYGANFKATLSNRPIRTFTKVTASNSINIAWVGKDDKCLGTEWSYTGRDQQPKRYFSRQVTGDQADTTLISSCDLTKPVTYRTLFAPETQAVDTFYTDYKAL